jgi:hypothetical protein
LFTSVLFRLRRGSFQGLLLSKDPYLAMTSFLDIGHLCPQHLVMDIVIVPIYLMISVQCWGKEQWRYSSLEEKEKHTSQEIPGLALLLDFLCARLSVSFLALQSSAAPLEFFLSIVS